ncbi:helix-turn-helix domain-containing protein [Rhodococcus sp. MEB064]|uniref:helix-turn-helix domain-containing protein n=1 Tax=Rhodococcus sp. MEB064 TaxID=1587522 RepID=UPI000695A7FA|nr:helix-turn-helix transcriptional regulator [Rhodococcus sp. MEB064]
MPNIDREARRWQLDLAARVGQAVRYWRDDVRGYSASRLSERCADLGYPISRVAVSKIENNVRAGKLELAELMVLARALDVSPVQLVYPSLPYGGVENTPGAEERSLDALMWFVGRGQVHYRLPDPQLAEIAGEEVTDEHRAQHEENQRYAEATRSMHQIDVLVEMESALDRLTSQLRHPSFSGKDDDSVARREAIGEKLSSVVGAMGELLDDFKKAGMTVDWVTELPK